MQKQENNIYQVRQPPNAPDMEKLALGTILDNWHMIDEVVELIPDPDHFYFPAHQVIYETILLLWRKGYPADNVTVTNELRKAGKLEAVGNPIYLVSLINMVTSVEPLKNACIEIKDCWMRRGQIKVSAELTNLAYDQGEDVFETFDKVEQSLFNLSQISAAKGISQLSVVGDKVLKNIQQVRASAVALTGVATGFQELDRKTNGWQKTDLIIVAARPAVGKTAFALNLAYNSAVAGVPAAIFNLEMGEQQLTKRILSATSRVLLEKINKPHSLDQWEVDKLTNTWRLQKEIPLYIDDTAAITIPLFRSKLRKLIRKAAIGLVIIDYLQLMRGNEKKNGNREQEISQISRDLKAIAKELEIPIIALSQLNRIGNDTEPVLANLRESGAIEQDADVVLFLYNPSEDDKKKNPELANKKMLSCAKHRNGDTFYDLLQFNKEIQLFQDLNTDLFTTPVSYPGYQTQKKIDNSHLETKSKLTYDPGTNTYIANANLKDDLPF